MIILWQNILGHQQGALNSLLTTIPNRNYRANCSGLILQKKIRKFAQNIQTSKQTNTQRFQKQRPPYPLWSVDRRGTRANNNEKNDDKEEEKEVEKEENEDEKEVGSDGLNDVIGAKYLRMEKIVCFMENSIYVVEVPVKEH